jgi:hypothetical protein
LCFLTRESILKSLCLSFFGFVYKFIPFFLSADHSSHTGIHAEHAQHNNGTGLALITKPHEDDPLIAIHFSAVALRRPV